jgi:hypothetical protein
MDSPTAGRQSLRGFSHSEIPGSKPVSGSPRLIAAVHVLLRLSSPRHPPCALCSLIAPKARIELMPGVRTSNSRTPGKCNLASATRQHAASGPFASLDAITFSFHRSRQAAYAVTLRHRGRACFRPGTAPGQIFRQAAHRPVAGGADRNRTDDLRLAKPALSQLSYSPLGRPAATDCCQARPSGKTAWARADLNCRPHAYQACALTN